MVVRERNVRMSNDDKRYAIRRTYAKAHVLLWYEIQKQTDCTLEEANFHCDIAYQQALCMLDKCPPTEINITNWLRNLAIYHQNILEQLDQYLPLWKSKSSGKGKSFTADDTFLADTTHYARNNILQRFTHPEPPTYEKLDQWLDTLLEQRKQVAELEQFLTNHYSELLNYARKQKHTDDADYLVSEAFIRAQKFLMRKADNILPKEDSRMAWTKRIIRNAFLDETRKKSEMATESLDTDTSEQNKPADKLHYANFNVEEHITDGEAERELARLLHEAKLASQQREIMKLSLLENMSDQEIADQLNMKVETVRSTIKRKRVAILLQFPPKLLHQYLQIAPHAKLRMFRCISTYTASGYNSVAIRKLRLTLSRYVTGMDAQEIAYTDDTGSISVHEATANIQKQLNKHLPKLFQAFFKKEEKDAGKGE